MHQSLQGATFHVEHIIPRSRGGTSETENLAWACPGCNLHKSNRVEVISADDQEPIPLFHPRRHEWDQHFVWENYRIVGSSCIAERRGIEIVDTGAARTDYMRFGDRIKIEVLDRAGQSVFGSIDQQVVARPPPGSGLGR